MKTRRFADEVYGSQFVLLWGGTPEQFKRHIQSRYDKHYDDDCDFVGRCFETDEPQVHTIIVMLPNWRAGWRAANQISVLSHELFHATEYELRYRGIEHTAETSEAYAYFFDSLIQRCLEILP